MTATGYLPIVTEDALQALLYSNDWSSVERVLTQGGFERVGLDRFYRIYCDLTSRRIEPCGLRVLDVGCNNGLIARAFAAAGATVLGIDNAAVDGQGKYDPLDFHNARRTRNCHLLTADLLDLLDTTSTVWDVVLLLSVAHHWRTGYAMSGDAIYSEDEIDRIFSHLSRRCLDSLYIEYPNDEPGFPAHAGLSVVEKHLGAPHERTDLGYTIGPGGYPRRLLRIRF